MRQIIILFFATLSCLISSAEVRIQMEKEAGVYKVPCTVNGLKLKFIFDTGASNVSISSTYADMMLENGYLLKSDIKGSSKVSLADGRIVDNVVINLRSVIIGGQTLENVSAIVVPTQNAPLLLGQSVIQRLGRVSIDGNDLVIHNANIYSEDEMEAIYKKAVDFYRNEIYSEALKYFKIIYDSYGDMTHPRVLFGMGTCCAYFKDYDHAVKYYLKAIDIDDGENEDGILSSVYDKLSLIYYIHEDYNTSIDYALLQLKYAIDDVHKATSYSEIANVYTSLEDYSKADYYADLSINTFQMILKMNILDDRQAHAYIQSYLIKGLALENAHKYEQAIEMYMTGKRKIDLFKNQNMNFDNLTDLFNMNLSSCYDNLVKH